jgi:Reverse transcriptase (RNA-dependent DNA polymerase)
MFTYKDKDSGPKSRFVVLGHLQKNKPPPSDKFASTPHPAAVRCIYAMAAQSGNDVHVVDISQAFVQSDDLPDRYRVYVHPPAGYESDPDVVWRLIKPLYGLAIAPRAWAKTLRSFLLSQGWSPVGFEDTFFSYSKGDVHMHLVHHIDDILLSFSNKDAAEAQRLKRAILTRFEGKDLGPVSRYLGVDIIRNADGSIELSQEHLVLELLAEHDMLDCNPAPTPMDPNLHLELASVPQHLNNDIYAKYNKVVGSLRYLCEWTVPEISFAAQVLARHLSNPGPDHWAAAKRVLRYLKGVSSLSLKYSPQSDTSLANRLLGFADSDWAADRISRRSVGSWVYLLNGGAVSWKSKQHPCVAVSTSEAEFMSASKAALEAVWLRRILADAGAPQASPTPLYEDNRSCRLMSENPVHRERSKHIDIRVYSLREQVERGVVRLIDCPTADMTADALTKALPAPAFIKHRQCMRGHSPPSAPRFPQDLTVPAHCAIVFHSAGRLSL